MIKSILKALPCLHNWGKWEDEEDSFFQSRKCAKCNKAERRFSFDFWYDHGLQYATFKGEKYGTDAAKKSLESVRRTVLSYYKLIEAWEKEGKKVDSLVTDVLEDIERSAKGKRKIDKFL